MRKNKRLERFWRFCHRLNCSKGGRRDLRAALQMPAIVAMTHNPDLHAFAERLRAKGKNTQAVITAVLRKLLVLANTLVAENRLWTPQRP